MRQPGDQRQATPFRGTGRTMRGWILLTAESWLLPEKVGRGYRGVALEKHFSSLREHMGAVCLACSLLPVRTRQLIINFPNETSGHRSPAPGPWADAVDSGCLILCLFVSDPGCALLAEAQQGGSHRRGGPPPGQTLQGSPPSCSKHNGLCGQQPHAAA